MNRAEFEAWRDYEDKIETERYGTPSFRRELVLVDERGAEVSIEATLEAGEAERARLASQLETQRIAYLRGHETGAASMRKFLDTVRFDSSRREAISIREGLWKAAELAGEPGSVGILAAWEWIGDRIRRNDEILRQRGFSTDPAPSVDTLVERARWEAVCAGIAAEDGVAEPVAMRIVGRAKLTEEKAEARATIDDSLPK